MSAKLKKEDLLLSWKEIASYLDCNVRTCRRWEKDLGLPVHRFEKLSKSRVFAYKEELDKWLEKSFAKKSTSRLLSFPKLKWHKHYYFLMPIVAALIIIFLLAKTTIIPIPADFKINNSALIILDKKGKDLWQYDTGIENLVDEEEYKKYFQYKKNRPGECTRDLPHLMIKDINNDSLPEVLFSIQTINEFGEGEILCFDSKGNIIWTFKSERELKFGKKVYSPDYRILGFDVFDLDHDGKLEIIVNSAHLPDFPSQLAILDSEGNVLGEYWNSGRLQDFACTDINDDSRLELIVAAMNNEYAKPSLIVFDISLIEGSSPQNKEFYKCNEFKPGSEKYYVLFPKVEEVFIEGLMESISRIDILKNNRIRATSAGSNIIYEFDYGLILQDVRLSHSFQYKYERAYAEGKIDSELSEEYIRNLAQGLLYYDGKNWVSYPAMTSYWKTKSSGN